MNEHSNRGALPVELEHEQRRMTRLQRAVKEGNDSICFPAGGLVVAVGEPLCIMILIARSLTSRILTSSGASAAVAGRRVRVGGIVCDGQTLAGARVG